MDALALLDVIIGMVFIYAVMALACTALNEYFINTVGRCRGQILKKGIRNLLGNDTDHSVLDNFYSHPLIRSLHPPGRLPSKIPPDSFAGSVLDGFIHSVGDDGKVEFDTDANAEKGTDRNAPVYGMIRHLFKETGGDYQKMLSGLETWYTHATDRMIGWYKRKMQVWSLLFATLLTIGMNVDSVALVRSLYSNPDTRDMLVSMAAESDEVSFFTTDPNSKNEGPVVNTVVLKGVTAEIEDIAGLPIGWDGDFWKHIIGWLFTIIAVSFGAPFWFDMLSRLMRIRSEMVESKKEDEITQSAS